MSPEESLKDFISKLDTGCYNLHIPSVSNSNCMLAIDTGSAKKVEEFLELRNIPVYLSSPAYHSVYHNMAKGKVPWLEDGKMWARVEGKISWIGEAMEIWNAVERGEYQKAEDIVNRLENRTTTLSGIKFQKSVNEDIYLLGDLIYLAKIANGEKVDYGPQGVNENDLLDSIKKRLVSHLEKSRM